MIYHRKKGEHRKKEEKTAPRPQTQRFLAIQRVSVGAIQRVSVGAATSVRVTPAQLTSIHTGFSANDA
jgi:hypothetical protein